MHRMGRKVKSVIKNVQNICTVFILKEMCLRLRGSCREYERKVLAIA
jgi:hypothetical protein